jgi:hypothetical protein
MPEHFSYAETQARMSLEHRIQLLAHLLRVPELFVQARSVLRAEHFGEVDEPHLQIIWKTAVKAANDHGSQRLFINSQQTWNLLSAECRSYVAANTAEMPEEFHAQLFDPAVGVLAWIFGLMKPEEINITWGRSLLVSFLNERWVQDPVRQAMLDAGDQTITNLPILFREAEERRATVNSLAEDESEAITPEWVPRGLNKIPTAVDFVDDILHGGDCSGETYGILGAFKAGKTTLAIQLAVGAAAYELDQISLAAQDHRTHQVRYPHLFHYEAGAEEMKSRILVNAARIHRETVENWNTAPLSRQGQLKPYELETFRDEIRAIGIANVPGEFERFHQRQGLMNMIRLHDMSGPKSNPKRGSRGIAEIAERLEIETRKGRPPRRVIIDYAQLCVKRLILENSMRQDMYYPTLSNFGYDCLRSIAIPFDCPVWIMGQLSGQANKHTWATKQHHADAAGTASFGENLWFCFTLSVKNEQHNAMWFKCGISRRTDVGDPIIVRLEGALGTIRRAPEIIEQGGRLILAAEATSDLHQPSQGHVAQAGMVIDPHGGMPGAIE